jgi:hypothetical protein
MAERNSCFFENSAPIVRWLAGMFETVVVFESVFMLKCIKIIFFFIIF